MYPISVTSAAAFSDAAEGGGDGDSREGAAVQASISGDDAQNSEGHFAIASSDVTSNIAVAVDEGVSTNGRGGSSFQRRCTTEAGVSSSDFTADGGVFDLLGIMAPLEGAQIIDSLFLKVDVFARRIYEDTVANQLPPDISGKLTATGRAIWHGTYRVMCEASFVSMCLREYHSKHRPGFIRAIPRIRLLSSSSGSDAVSLAGDGLLNFLSRLDCAVRTKVESIFNYAWSQVVDSTLSALEGGSLNSVVCKDFADVLDIAGVPAAALSAAHSAMYTISKGTGRSRGALVEDSSTSSSLSISAENSNLPSSTIEASSSCVSSSVQCVDLLDVKLHPDSARMICKLFSDINKSAKTSCSRSIANYLSEIVNSRLPEVGKAIWCRTYRELHLFGLISRCLCIYHSKYRPNFIRKLSDIRVLSGPSDCSLVTLSGGSLLNFLSRLDCTIRGFVESMFVSYWDEVASSIFSGLEGGSLSDVCCEDVINVLDIAGIPVEALSVSERYSMSKSKASGGSGKRTLEGAKSGASASASDLTRSSATSISQFQSELPSSETESLPNPPPQSEGKLRPLLLLEDGSDQSEDVSDQSSYRFVKLLCYRDTHR